MKWVLKGLVALLALIGLLVVVLALNTWRQGSRQIDVPPLQPIAVDEKAAAASLAVAVRAKTVSSLGDAALNADQFEALHAHLQARYPKLHAALTREVVGGLSLLYTWPGSDPSAKGIVLMAHQDVVPIAPGTEITLANRAFRRQPQGRLRVGSRLVGRQGQPDRADGSGGDARGFGFQAQAHDLPGLRGRRGSRWPAWRQGHRRLAEAARRQTRFRHRRRAADHRGCAGRVEAGGGHHRHCREGLRIAGAQRDGASPGIRRFRRPRAPAPSP